MNEVFDGNGTLRERWDDDTRTYTEWDAEGAQTSTRPYTAEENAAADAALAAEQARAEAATLAEAQEALVRATLALAPAPATGEAWVQPTGAHDAYAKDSDVTHAGKDWVSLTPFNVWEPGVSGWREVVSEGYPAWVQPTGGHDAYPLGAKVTHNGQDWENTGSASNVWEPGVFGWVTI